MLQSLNSRKYWGLKVKINLNKKDLHRNIQRKMKKEERKINDLGMAVTQLLFGFYFL